MKWRRSHLCHIETSPLICRANQWTSFYMIGTSVMKEIKRQTYVSSMFQLIWGSSTSHLIWWSMVMLNDFSNVNLTNDTRGKSKINWMMGLVLMTFMFGYSINPFTLDGTWNPIITWPLQKGKKSSIMDGKLLIFLMH